jgi:hypothetical protein
VLSVDDDTTYNNMEKELNDLTNEIKRMGAGRYRSGAQKAHRTSLSPKSQ